MNGVTGANQNFNTYWQRVKVAFNERKVVDPYFNKTHPDDPAPAASAGRPELSQKKLKEQKKAGHPADRLQVSFDKCWAARARRREGRQARRAVEGDARQPGRRIALLKETSAAKKRNTDLAFLIGGNDANMDEETRAWRFTRSHDIDAGHFVGFKYDGHSDFIVKVFDGTMCRRHYHSDKDD
ncbi:hypothetical protein QYE76_065717 [Lolium multiflorum]|uniref:Uncharacterized protein n=1 Tax=Lolium multiflorum TaxID=4521 RepID=A0AAD8WBF9_LOLMU|nr:hypothetical protein QYE76_065717 [Lolium multiflorum]